MTTPDSEPAVAPGRQAGANKPCWICGAPATTGEHLPKASLLRELLGPVNQKRPVHYHNDVERNVPLRTINSRLLKVNSVLCAKCNNETSQPFDRAWDQLWRFLRKNERSLRNGDRIRLNRVYRMNSRRKATNLHLYCVKLYGCIAAHYSIPLDVQGMAAAVIAGKTYPGVLMSLGKRTWLEGKQLVALSNVETENDIDGRCVFAVWFMTVGRWEFQFVYAEEGQDRRAQLNSWNPARGGRILLQDFMPGDIEDA